MVDGKTFLRWSNYGILYTPQSNEKKKYWICYNGLIKNNDTDPVATLLHLMDWHGKKVLLRTWRNYKPTPIRLLYLCRVLYVCWSKIELESKSIKAYLGCLKRSENRPMPILGVQHNVIATTDQTALRLKVRQWKAIEFAFERSEDMDIIAMAL